MGVFTALSIFAGAISGMFSMVNRGVQYNEKLRELQNQKTQLTDQYNLAVKQANAEAEDVIQQATDNIADARASRDISLGQNINTIVDQDRLANMQLAELQVQAAQSKGSAVQNVALSGTRLMQNEQGEIGNASVYATESANNRQLNYAKEQTKAQIRQSIGQAQQNYFSANMQIAAYERQKKYTKSALNRTLESLELQYNQQKENIDYDINYMTSGKGQFMLGASMIGDYFSGILNGFSSGLSLYNSGVSAGLWEPKTTGTST